MGDRRWWAKAVGGGGRPGTVPGSRQLGGSVKRDYFLQSSAFFQSAHALGKSIRAARIRRRSPGPPEQSRIVETRACGRGARAGERTPADADQLGRTLRRIRHGIILHDTA